MSLYAVSNGSSARRGYFSRVRRRVEPTLLAKARRVRLRWGSADHLAVVDDGVAREDHRQHELVEVDLALAGDPA